MCGRFTINLTHDELEGFVKKRYKIGAIPNFVLPRFNVSPSTNIISVIYDGSKNRIGELKWGFIPSFDSKSPLNLINAKAETIFDKPSFKDSALNRRCVVIADSFYEWNKYQKSDYPRRIMRKDKSVFSMAGIWNQTVDKNGVKTFSVAIVTVDSNELMRSIHDRMPVILNEESEAIWLNTSIKDINVLKSVLISYPSDYLMMYKVSRNVNSPSNDDESLLVEVDE